MRTVDSINAAPIIRRRALRFSVPCDGPRRARIARRFLLFCVSTFIRRFGHKQSAIIAPALVERRIIGEPSRVRDAHATLAIEGPLDCPLATIRMSAKSRRTTQKL